jgi:hypothetical protein
MIESRFRFIGRDVDVEGVEVQVEVRCHPQRRTDSGVNKAPQPQQGAAGSERNCQGAQWLLAARHLARRGRISETRRTGCYLLHTTLRCRYIYLHVCVQRRTTSVEPMPTTAYPHTDRRRGVQRITWPLGNAQGWLLGWFVEDARSQF